MPTQPEQSPGDGLPLEPYNGIALQRERILACLRSAGSAGVLRSDLEARCNVPSATSRIAELRNKFGHDIKSHKVQVIGADGMANDATRYELAEGSPAQGSLFPEGTQP